MGRGGGQQGHGVGPDGEEGHVSQIQQACQADHDVQSQPEQDVDADRAEGVIPILAGAQGQQQQDHHRQAVGHIIEGRAGAKFGDRGQVIHAAPQGTPSRGQPAEDVASRQAIDQRTAQEARERQEAQLQECARRGRLVEEEELHRSGQQLRQVGVQLDARGIQGACNVGNQRHDQPMDKTRQDGVSQDHAYGLSLVHGARLARPGPQADQPEEQHKTERERVHAQHLGLRLEFQQVLDDLAGRGGEADQV